MNIKCIGCFNLTREVVAISGMGLKVYRTDGNTLVLYYCSEGRFPYQTVVSGLIRPGMGISKAAIDCPEDPLSHCILCSETNISHYGQDIVSICREHDRAWGKWLDEHPEKREHIAPRGRSVKANWVEVFREFIEDMRQKQGV